MTWLSRLLASWHLARVIPRHVEGLTPEEKSQLVTFLKATGAGQKLLTTLRNGVVESAMRTTTASDTNGALLLAGEAKGYQAAVATIDVLTGAYSQTEEVEPSSPVDFGVAG